METGGDGGRMETLRACQEDSWWLLNELEAHANAWKDTDEDSILTSQMKVAVKAELENRIR